MQFWLSMVNFSVTVLKSGSAKRKRISSHFTNQVDESWHFLHTSYSVVVTLGYVGLRLGYVVLRLGYVMVRLGYVVVRLCYG